MRISQIFKTNPVPISQLLIREATYIVIKANWRIKNVLWAVIIPTCPYSVLYSAENNCELYDGDFSCQNYNSKSHLSELEKHIHMIQSPEQHGSSTKIYTSAIPRRWCKFTLYTQHSCCKEKNSMHKILFQKNFSIVSNVVKHHQNLVLTFYVIITYQWFFFAKAWNNAFY